MARLGAGALLALLLAVVAAEAAVPSTPGVGIGGWTEQDDPYGVSGGGWTFGDNVRRTTLEDQKSSSTPTPGVGIGGWTEQDDPNGVSGGSWTFGDNVRRTTLEDEESSSTPDENLTEQEELGVSGGGWTFGDDLRRTLAARQPTTRYISYAALRADQVPCNKRGRSYYSNCEAQQAANPYRRGCSAITRCARNMN